MRRDNLFIEDILYAINKIFQYTEEMYKEESEAMRDWLIRIDKNQI